MGAMFVGQQFLQNVLGYSTLEAGAAILPAVVFMVLVAPRSAKLVEARGARFTLLARLRLPACSASSRCCCSGTRAAPYWQVGLAYAFIGIGVGLRRHAGLALADRIGAGAAGRHGLGHRGPPARPGRRDHAVDLRRAAHRRAMPPAARRRDRRGAEQRRRSPTASRTSCTKSFAERRARSPQQYPQYASQITAAAKPSFLDGDQLGLHGRHRRGRSSVRRSSSSCSRSKDEEQRLLAGTPPRTRPGDGGAGSGGGEH